MKSRIKLRDGKIHFCLSQIITISVLNFSPHLFQVMANQEAVDIARKTKDPQRAAKQLAAEALNRDSKDDISCIVVRFKG